MPWIAYCYVGAGQGACRGMSNQISHYLVLLIAFKPRFSVVMTFCLLTRSRDGSATIEMGSFSSPRCLFELLNDLGPSGQVLGNGQLTILPISII